MVVGKLELEISTTIKRIDMVATNVATNKEIIEALKQVIEIPEGLIGLQLRLKEGEAPQITFTQIAEAKEDKK